MSVWYEMEKTEKGYNEFLNCNWGFHDFSHERIEYVPGKNMVEIFLQYDIRLNWTVYRDLIARGL